MSLRSLCVTLLLGIVPAAPAVAEPPKPLTSQELALTAPPAAGSGECTSISNKVQGWMGQVAEGNPVQVKDARKELASALRKPEVTPVFHRFFLEVASPEVAKMVAAGDAFRVTNALMVIRFVKTPEAFELVRQQCDPARQKDVRIRASAANLLPAMVDGGSIPPAQMDGVARRITELVENETDWVVAAQEMAAISRLASRAAEAKMASQAAAIRMDLVAAVGSVVERMKAGKDKAPAPACYRGLIAVRDQVMTMNQSERSQMASALLPILKQVEDIPENPSADASGDEMEWRGARKVAGTLKGLLSAKR
jgi:hypothetical protein